ncbi:MAG: DivIVA domain-containing protein [Clostridia bacterium]|nr:DivIVA domain-containing protein [Clostridia bacterium]
MLTPLDIKTTKFSTSALGYKKAEVDAFMDEILKNYEKLYKTVNDSNDKIKALNKQIETYASIEETMKNTLVVAQSSAEQLTAAARSEADSIVAEANIKSREIIEKATNRLESLTARYEALKTEISRFMEHSKAEFTLQINSLEKAKESMEKTTI